MKYELISNFRDNKHFNSDFLNLIKRYDEKSTFESWLTKARLEGNFIPFGLIDEKNNLVACAGVMRTKLYLNDKKYEAIQMGKIFSKDDGKDQPIREELLDQIVNKFESVVDAIYIYDDDIKNINKLHEHGFVKGPDKTIWMPWNGIKNNSDALVVKKINVEEPKEFVELLESVKHSSRENEFLSTAGDAPVKLYNILKEYPRNVFYIPSLEATIVFTIRDSIFKLVAVFSDNKVDIAKLLQIVVPEHINKIEFGFIPKLNEVHFTPKSQEEIDNDKSSFWIKSISMKIDEKFMFPPILAKGK